MATLSQAIVRSFLTRKERGLPQALREKTVLHIVDEVGIALAAKRGAPAAPQAIKALFVGGARGDCQVIGGGPGLPPTLAAFANSSLCHAMDYDDIHDECHAHITSTTFPAALAAADIVGAPGSTVVDAVALGNELMCRMGIFQDAVGDERMPGFDYFLSQFHGYFGAALSAGVVLGLSEDELVSAIGLAYMQVSGAKEAAFGIGCDARAIYPGFGAMGGVHAAILAKTGVSGPATALDGPAGLYKAYLRMEPTQDKIDRILQTDDWDFAGAKIKPYPSCRASHLYVEAAQQLRDKIPLQKIEKIVAEVSYRSASLCSPLEARRRPGTLQDAKYSIPFMIGFALARGDVGLHNLNASALDDADALRYAALVDPVVQPERRDNPPGNITVQFSGGSVESPRTGPPHLSMEDVSKKFLDCCRYAGLGDAGPGILDRLLHMEDAKVSELISQIEMSA